MLGGYDLARSSKLTWYRSSSMARTFPASTTACTPRGLAPYRTYRFTESLANSPPGWLASTSRIA